MTMGAGIRRIAILAKEGVGEENMARPRSLRNGQQCSKDHEICLFNGMAQEWWHLMGQKTPLSPD